jgi:hypothetical protein
VKYWEIIADNLSKPVGAWAGSQLWIVKGAQSGLRTRIAATETGSLCAHETLTAFVELESAS